MHTLIKVLFLIRSLNPGGAERQLLALAKGMDSTRFGVTVVTLYDGGSLRAEFDEIKGIAVLSLHKRGRWDVFRPLFRLAQIMRAIRPDIVHGYMNVANELALLFGKPFGAKVIWGLRSSNMDFAQYDWLPRFAFKAGARLSRFADLIIANSQAGLRHHQAHGYATARMRVIPNGFDTTRFRPDRKAGLPMRHAWGCSPQHQVIGLVARLDPMKDHPTFLHAAARLRTTHPEVYFVCVGDGPAAYRAELQALGTALGLADRLVWAGEAADMPAVQNALDIATSASAFGEGFSNALAEAMACGVPCVATDVGDSARIVGSTGIIVPKTNPAELAAAWSKLLSLSDQERQELGNAARSRIVEQYGVQALAQRTADALGELGPDAS